MKSRKWKLFGLVAVVSGSALIPPILFGEARITKDQIGGDPWRNIIFDFQTLLTGMAAVAAASWTVYTMEKTDVRQERRHQQLVSLAIRADSLRADRAVNPQLEDFEYYVDEVIAKLKHSFGSEENAIQQFEGGSRGYRALVVTIETFFNRAPFEQAQDLFDGEMAYALTRIRDAINKIDHSWQRAEYYSPPLGMTRAQYTLSNEELMRAYFSWREAANDTLAHLLTLEEFTSAFYEGMLKMKATYRL